MPDHVIHVLGPLDVPGIGARYVRVYVPPGEPRGNRDVLYMFDAQNLLHDEPSYAGGWHLHKTTYRMAKKHGVAPVIVGIDHGGAARIDELSPFQTERSKGLADFLLDWLTHTLIPRIASEYGVSREPPHVGVGGSSMGGLMALYAHFRNPEAFGLVLCMSPSLWFAGSRIFEYVAQRPKPWTSRIYIDAGALEGRGGMLASATRMAELLRGRGYDDASLMFLAVKRCVPTESHWRKRAPKALAFLFPSPTARATRPPRRASKPPPSKRRG